MTSSRYLLLSVGVALAAGVGHAQQPGARPAYDGSAQPDVARQIFLDGGCRILPNPALPLLSRKSRPFRDSTICSIESASQSEHMEEQISGNQLLRSRVRVIEETFVLQNITADHIVFVVERPVPQGWTVDSDPQPNRCTGSNAVFPVHAQPGETVQLHVGIRNSKALKPKMISVGANRPPAQPGPAS